MIKLIACFRFKSGLSREDGIHYYETRHVPLINEVLPHHFADYRRNYMIPDSSFFPAHMEGTPPPPPGFDMITELWIEDKPQYNTMIAAMANPAIGSRISADEANFLDRSSMVMFLVDEHRSPAADLADAA